MENEALIIKLFSEIENLKYLDISSGSVIELEEILYSIKAYEHYFNFLKILLVKNCSEVALNYYDHFIDILPDKNYEILMEFIEFIRTIPESNPILLSKLYHNIYDNTYYDHGIIMEALKFIAQNEETESILEFCKQILNKDPENIMAVEFVCKIYVDFNPDAAFASNVAKLVQAKDNGIYDSPIIDILTSCQMSLQKNYFEALKILMNSYNTCEEPSPECLYFMAKIYINVNDLKSAQNTLEEGLGLKEYTNICTAFWDHFQFLTCQLWLAKPDENEKNLRNALNSLLELSNRNNIISNRLYGTIAICQSRLSMVEDSMKTLNERFEADTFDYNYIRGICEYHLKKTDAAKEHLLMALEELEKEVGLANGPPTHHRHMMCLDSLICSGTARDAICHIKLHVADIILEQCKKTNMAKNGDCDNSKLLQQEDRFTLRFEEDKLPLFPYSIASTLRTESTQQFNEVINNDHLDTTACTLVKALFECAEHNPYEPHAYYLLGQCYLALYNHYHSSTYDTEEDREKTDIYINESIECLERSCELYAYEHFECSKLLADVYLVKLNYDSYKQLLETLVDTLSSQPKNYKISWVYRRLGLYNLQNGMYEDAIHCFTQVFHQDPHDMISWKGLAEAYFHNKSYKASSRAFAEVLKHYEGELFMNDSNKDGGTVNEREKTRAPTLLYYENKLAVLELKLGEHFKAISSFERILTQNPSYKPSILGLVETYVDLAENSINNHLDAKAISCVSKALTLMMNGIILPSDSYITTIITSQTQKPKDLSYDPLEWMHTWVLLGRVCGLLSPLPPFTLVELKLLMPHDKNESETVTQLSILDLLRLSHGFYCKALTVNANVPELWTNVIHSLASIYIYEKTMMIISHTSSQKPNMNDNNNFPRDRAQLCDPLQASTTNHLTCRYLQQYVITETCGDVSILEKYLLNLCRLYVTSINARDQFVLNILGVISCYEGAFQDFRLARQIFELCGEKIDPNDPLFPSNLGVLNLLKGEDKEANRLFTRAQISNPKYPHAWVGQATLAEKLGNFEEAIDIYQHTFTLWHNKFNVVKCGRALLRLFCNYSAHSIDEQLKASKTSGGNNDLNDFGTEDGATGWNSDLDNPTSTDQAFLNKLERQFMAQRDSLRLNKIINYATIELEALALLLQRYPDDYVSLYLYSILYFYMNSSHNVKFLFDPYLSPLHGHRPEFNTRDIVYHSGRALVLFLKAESDNLDLNEDNLLLNTPDAPAPCQEDRYSNLISIACKLLNTFYHHQQLLRDSKNSRIEQDGGGGGVCEKELQRQTLTALFQAFALFFVIAASSHRPPPNYIKTCNNSTSPILLLNSNHREREGLQHILKQLYLLRIELGATEKKSKTHYDENQEALIPINETRKFDNKGSKRAGGYKTKSYNNVQGGGKTTAITLTALSALILARLYNESAVATHDHLKYIDMDVSEDSIEKYYEESLLAVKKTFDLNDANRITALTPFDRAKLKILSLIYAYETLSTHKDLLLINEKLDKIHLEELHLNQQQQQSSRPNHQNTKNIKKDAPVPHSHPLKTTLPTTESNALPTRNNQHHKPKRNEIRTLDIEIKASSTSKKSHHKSASLANKQHQSNVGAAAECNVLPNSSAFLVAINYYGEDFYLNIGIDVLILLSFRNTDQEIQTQINDVQKGGKVKSSRDRLLEQIRVRSATLLKISNHMLKADYGQRKTQLLYVQFLTAFYQGLLDTELLKFEDGRMKGNVATHGIDLPREAVEICCLNPQQTISKHSYLFAQRKQTGGEYDTLDILICVYTGQVRKAYQLAQSYVYKYPADMNARILLFLTAYGHNVLIKTPNFKVLSNMLQPFINYYLNEREDFCFLNSNFQQSSPQLFKWIITSYILVQLSNPLEYPTFCTDTFVDDIKAKIFVVGLNDPDGHFNKELDTIKLIHHIAATCSCSGDNKNSLFRTLFDDVIMGDPMKLQDYLNDIYKRYVKPLTELSIFHLTFLGNVMSRNLILEAARRYAIENETIARNAKPSPLLKSLYISIVYHIELYFELYFVARDENLQTTRIIVKEEKHLIQPTSILPSQINCAWAADSSTLKKQPTPSSHKSSGGSGSKCMIDTNLPFLKVVREPDYYDTLLIPSIEFSLIFSFAVPTLCNFLNRILTLLHKEEEDRKNNFLYLIQSAAATNLKSLLSRCKHLYVKYQPMSSPQRNRQQPPNSDSPNDPSYDLGKSISFDPQLKKLDKTIASTTSSKPEIYLGTSSMNFIILLDLWCDTLLKEDSSAQPTFQNYAFQTIESYVQSEPTLIKPSDTLIKFKQLFKLLS